MKENRGLTLVELLVTVAILSIVLLIATSFMLTGSSTFAKGSADTKVQKEAELAVNQMEDMIIDVNGGVDLKEDPATGDKELILFNAGGEGGTVSYTKESIVYKASEKKILCSKWNMIFDTAANDYKVDSAQYTDQLLAENVTGFSADISDVYKDTASDGSAIDIVKSVQIKVGYDDGNGKAAYATSPIVTLRNRMMKSDNPKRIFDETPTTTDTLCLYISQTDQAAAIPIQDGVTTVTRGESYSIFAMINNGSNINDLVDWEIEPSSPSSISDTGRLKVDECEPAYYLTITAKYKSNPNKKVSGVVKVIGNEENLKSLDGVTIVTKSLEPFNPVYGSIVSTTGFTDEDLTKLEYSWIVTSKEVNVSENVEIKNGTSGKEFSFGVKESSETYGKFLTVTLKVRYTVTGQIVSDSITYRVDWEGTVSGDSNTKRGRLSDADLLYHESNQMGLSAVLRADLGWPVEVTMDKYFCDEYGNRISALDCYLDCVVLRPNSYEGYYITFTEDLPADRAYYIKVIRTYSGPYGIRTYERIHYIPAVQIYGEYTMDASAPVDSEGNFTPYGRFDFYYNIVGYYDLAWVNSAAYAYEVTLDYEAPEGVTVEGSVVQTTTETDDRIHGQVGDFQVETGGKDYWTTVKEIKIKSARIKVYYKNNPAIYSYATVVFK